MVTCSVNAPKILNGTKQPKNVDVQVMARDLLVKAVKKTKNQNVKLMEDHGMKKNLMNVYKFLTALLKECLPVENV